MKSKIKEYNYLLALVYLTLSYKIIAVFNTQILAKPHTNTTLPIDLKIPAFPGFVTIYYSYFIILFIPLLLPKKERNKIAIDLLILSTIAHLIFILFPTSIIRWSDFGHLPFFSWERPLLSFMYGEDINSNCFPTLHVIHSLWISLFFFKLQQDKISIFLICWALLIAVSTLIIRQHSILDVMGAGFVCYLYYFKDNISSIIKTKFN